MIAARMKKKIEMKTKRNITIALATLLAALGASVAVAQDAQIDRTPGWRRCRLLSSPL